MKKVFQKVLISLLAVSALVPTIATGGISASAVSLNSTVQSSVSIKGLTGVWPQIIGCDKYDVATSCHIFRLDANRKTASATLKLYDPMGIYTYNLQDFKLSSSDTNVAKINAYGRIDVVHPGACVINIKEKSTGNSKSVRIVATVNEQDLTVSLPGDYNIGVWNYGVFKSNLYAEELYSVAMYLHGVMTVKFNNYVIPKNYYAIATSYRDNGKTIRIGLSTNVNKTYDTPLFYNEKIYTRKTTEVNLNAVHFWSDYCSNESNAMQIYFNKDMFSGNNRLAYSYVNKVSSNLVRYNYDNNCYVNIKKNNLVADVTKIYNKNNRKYLQINIHGLNNKLVYGSKTAYAYLSGSVKDCKVTINGEFYNDGRYFVGASSKMSVAALSNTGKSIGLTYNQQYDYIVTRENNIRSPKYGFGENAIKILVRGLNDFKNSQVIVYKDGRSTYVPYAYVYVNGKKSTSEWGNKYEMRVNANTTKNVTVKFDKEANALYGDLIDNRKLTVKFAGSVASYKKVSEDSRYIVYNITFDASKVEKGKLKVVSLSLMNGGGKELAIARFNVTK